jgi:tetratricopeptide (TPR) repeat protein
MLFFKKKNLKQKFDTVRVMARRKWRRLAKWQRVGITVLAMAAVAAVLAAVVLRFMPLHNPKWDKPLSNATAESYRKQLPALKAKADNDKDAGAIRDFAIALYVTGQYDDAVFQYNRAIKASPKDSALYNNLANVQRDQGHFNDAVTNYNKALSINSQLVTAYVNLANVQIYSQRKLDAGIITYEHGIDVMPDNAQLKILLGLAYEQKGKTAEAKAQYQDVLDSDPTNQAAKSNLARLNGK